MRTKNEENISWLFTTMYALVCSKLYFPILFNILINSLLKFIKFCPNCHNRLIYCSSIMINCAFKVCLISCYKKNRLIPLKTTKFRICIKTTNSIKLLIKKILIKFQHRKFSKNWILTSEMLLNWQ